MKVTKEEAAACIEKIHEYIQERGQHLKIIFDWSNNLYITLRNERGLYCSDGWCDIENGEKPVDFLEEKEEVEV